MDPVRMKRNDASCPKTVVYASWKTAVESVACKSVRGSKIRQKQVRKAVSESDAVSSRKRGRTGCEDGALRRRRIPPVPVERFQPMVDVRW